MEKIILILLVIMAIFIILTKDLKKMIIFMAVLSLLSSLIFLLYNAPDVAIAEAIMSAAISTILYLVAIRRKNDKSD